MGPNTIASQAKRWPPRAARTGCTQRGMFGTKVLSLAGFRTTQACCTATRNCAVVVGGLSMSRIWTAIRAPSQYPKRRLSVRSRKVSKLRDLYLESSDRSEIWQALRQQCCRCACQISKRYDNLKYQSRGFETLRDLAKRRLFGYWDGALVPEVFYGIHIRAFVWPIHDFHFLALKKINEATVSPVADVPSTINVLPTDGGIDDVLGIVPACKNDISQ